MKNLLLGIAFGAAVAAPMFLPVYYVNIGTQILIAAICASGLNILVGYAGLIAIGHPVLLGVGAYVCAILELNTGLGHIGSIVVSIASVTAVAAVFGPLALRSAGLSFMMITMAFGQILWGLAYRWSSMTGGDNGLTLPHRPTLAGYSLDDPANFYYVTLIVFVLALGAIATFIGSRLGAGLQGTKEQPRRMSALGYDVSAVRWIAFVFSAFWCAVAGVLFAYFFKYIHPQQLALGSAAEYLLMVIAGGAGTLAGPILGAAIVVIVKNAVSSYVDRWMMLLGFIFIGVVLFLPDGLVPGFKRLWQTLRRRMALGMSIDALYSSDPAVSPRPIGNREVKP